MSVAEHDGWGIMLSACGHAFFKRQHILNEKSKKELRRITKSLKCPEETDLKHPKN